MKLFITFVAASLCTACGEAVPDYGTGPFRGALFDMGSGNETPAVLSNETEEVAEAPKPAVTEPIVTKVPEPAPIAAAVALPEPTTGQEVTPIEPEQAVEQETDEPDANEEVQLMNFDDMADFDYTAPTLDEIESGAERPEQVPAELLAFNDALVEIEGYMIPIEVEQGKVKSFILSRTLSGCCFGDMPNIQEWVDVKMQDGMDADYIPYAPVLVIGRMSVGELVDEYGITSLYRMTAESVEDPW